MVTGGSAYNNPEEHSDEPSNALMMDVQQLEKTRVDVQQLEKIRQKLIKTHDSVINNGHRITTLERRSEGLHARQLNTVGILNTIKTTQVKVLNLLGVVEERQSKWVQSLYAVRKYWKRIAAGVVIVGAGQDQVRQLIESLPL